MMDLTYTNLILMVGRHIFILVIGLMAVTFGIETPWPTSQVRAMIKEKAETPKASLNASANKK